MALKVRRMEAQPSACSTKSPEPHQNASKVTLWAITLFRMKRLWKLEEFEAQPIARTKTSPEARQSASVVMTLFRLKQPQKLEEYKL